MEKPSLANYRLRGGNGQAKVHAKVHAKVQITQNGAGD
jgi:hypothetical protein